MDNNNPYAVNPAVAFEQPDHNLDSATLKKAQAIVKDADQYLIAIALCLLCTGLGSIIIGPWYLARLLQWNAIAKKTPSLLDRNVPPKSLPQKFQSAKWKLIVGISFGAVMLLLVGAYVVLISVIA